ncbi:MAG: hypothetical protein ACP5KJ_02965 [Candidatus Micrarchaeia archaeon]
MLRVRTRTGVMLLSRNKIQICEEGFVEELRKRIGPVLGRFSNTDTIINMKDVKEVKYKRGLCYLLKPRIKIYYGNKLKRVVFKPAFTSYADAVKELEKTLEFFRTSGIKVNEG